MREGLGFARKSLNWFVFGFTLVVRPTQNSSYKPFHHFIFLWGFFVEPKEALGRQQSGVGRDVSVDDVTGQLEAEGC